MTQTIQQVLGDYVMFYRDQYPVEQLVPGTTLEKSVEVVNQNLRKDRNILNWSAGLQDEAARLLWVNWIYQRLGAEPIRKPILAHDVQGRLHVDCGDTRLMALNLLIDPGTVSVVVSVPSTQAANYQDWYPVKSNADLIELAEFGPGASVLLRTNSDGRVEWLEIGDRTTAHHLHDIDQRVRMMQNYLANQPADFVFSVDWARSYINWENYIN